MRKLCKVISLLVAVVMALSAGMTAFAFTFPTPDWGALLQEKTKMVETTDFELYAQGSADSAPFYGAKFEPRAGAYIGAVPEKSEALQPYGSYLTYIEGMRLTDFYYPVNSMLPGADVITMAGSSLGTTRLTMGINPHNFKWELDCNEVFTTPEVIMVHSADGLATMSNMFHKIIRDRILRGKFKRALRPIVINPWDAIGFDINEEILTDIAKTAAEIGIEMFVLDDGWFGNRNDDTSSLGDWTANKSKFKNGLAEFVDKINNFGLKFGLWFEPEMVSPNSDLYRKHPDWCIHAKDRARTENRRQLVLDLTRKEVREYVIDSVSNILDNANIEYVKWDCNRNITETRDQMQTHEYVLGLYEVLETLINKYPHVLFESCSGGGGRFDAGMLYYMPQTWTSDNVVPVTRLYIQYGTSMVYPPVSMTAHIGHLDIGYEKENKYMNTCAMVAMSGNFGYEFDLSKLSKTELEQAKTYAKMYKEIRNTVQYGDFYRLENPYTSDFCSFEFVDEDKAVVFTYQTREKTNGAERRIQLVGLQENEQYECDGHVYYGEELMKLGIRIPLEQYDYASDVRVFNKINTN